MTRGLLAQLFSIATPKSTTLTCGKRFSEKLSLQHEVERLQIPMDDQGRPSMQVCHGLHGVGEHLDSVRVGQRDVLEVEQPVDVTTLAVFHHEDEATGKGSIEIDHILVLQARQDLHLLLECSLLPASIGFSQLLHYDGAALPATKVHEAVFPRAKQHDNVK
eukprot:CAMPEP_0170584372 /NCGR_PEP_ID=MMETSP0224-20130122/8653_1 /TAXON_ID=285029 /ORGANISM="Togula jolla, Strain CCCM 725" /LENGTH=161 /DNA_ID=CAMNT_0010907801 /DNA_START=921 /DNA_END=1404 /DNA_ORIENTATION=+